MPALGRVGERDDDDVSGSRADFLITSGAAVGLGGLVGLDSAQLRGRAGERVGDEARPGAAVASSGRHTSVWRPGKTATVAITGVILSVRPEPLSSATSWTRRRLVASVVMAAGIAEESGVEALLLDDAAFQNHSLGAFALLGHLVAKTERLRLGVIAPVRTIRPPSILGKLLAGLDVVSSGRALGVLAPSDPSDATLVDSRGWSPGDLEAAEVVRLILSEESPSFSGRFFTLEHAWNEPRISSRSMPLYRVVVGDSVTTGELPSALFPLEEASAREGVAMGSEALIPLVVVGPLDSAAQIATRLGAARHGSQAVVLEWRGPLVGSRLREMSNAAVAAAASPGA